MQPEQTPVKYFNVSQQKKTKQDNKEKSETKQLIYSIYNAYFQEIKFSQIDYAAGQIPEGMLDATQHKQLMEYIAMVEECLIWTEKAYDKLYYYLLKNVQNQHNQWNFRNICADMLLTMNGENDKAYNFKKATLQKMLNHLQHQDKKEFQIQSSQMEIIEVQKDHKLDLQKELNLNSAITMKFKKTSSCYQYRIKLVQILLLENKNKTKDHINQFITNFHKSQHERIVKIIERFPRNYFCWTYRLRLFKQLIQIQNSYEINQRQVTMIQQILGKNTNDYSALSYFRFLLRNTQRQKYYSKILNLTIEKCSKLLQFCIVAYESEDNYKYFIEFFVQLKQKKSKIYQIQII